VFIKFFFSIETACRNYAYALGLPNAYEATTPARARGADAGRGCPIISPRRPQPINAMLLGHPSRPSIKQQTETFVSFVNGVSSTRKINRQRPNAAAGGRERLHGANSVTDNTTTWTRADEPELHCRGFHCYQDRVMAPTDGRRSRGHLGRCDLAADHFNDYYHYPCSSGSH
jgi:hypothetical protein